MGSSASVTLPAAACFSTFARLALQDEWSFCTRCRTAASESPTAWPIDAYDLRPSVCNCSMIALETESIIGAALDLVD